MKPEKNHRNMGNKKFEKFEEGLSLLQHINEKFIESIKKNITLPKDTNILERQLAITKKGNEKISKDMARQELHDLGVIYLNEDIIEQLRSMSDVDQEKVERLAYLYDIVVDKPEISQKELDLQQEIEEAKVIIDEYLKEIREGSVPTYTVYLPKFFTEMVPYNGKGNWHGISSRLNNVLVITERIYPLIFVTAKDLKKYFRKWGKVAITEFEQLLGKYGYSLGCKDLSQFNKKLDGVEYVEMTSNDLEEAMFAAWLRVENPKLVKEYIANRMQIRQDR